MGKNKRGATHYRPMNQGGESHYFGNWGPLEEFLEQRQPTRYEERISPNLSNHVEYRFYCASGGGYEALLVGAVAHKDDGFSKNRARAAAKDYVTSAAERAWHPIHAAIYGRWQEVDLVPFARACALAALEHFYSSNPDAEEEGDQLLAWARDGKPFPEWASDSWRLDHRTCPGRYANASAAAARDTEDRRHSYVHRVADAAHYALKSGVPAERIAALLPL